MSKEIILRPAEPQDVHNIHILLHDYAVQGVLLDRSEEDIAFYLKNFTVAVDENGSLLGCMAVRDFG
ncbi:MAG: GNAT family N-acetyltransferase, partial [Lentisphaeria bacterium]|nr:GNAT family N-acetyltransferase [Lentisphaeria bacterium]